MKGRWRSRGGGGGRQWESRELGGEWGEGGGGEWESRGLRGERDNGRVGG